MHARETTRMPRDRERARRIGLNEAMFREINERLETLQEKTSGQLGILDLVCECGDRDCAERITLTMDEYRALRSDPLLFAVLPAHEIPDVEDVVQQMNGWLIVRKHEGEPAAVARATDH
jgi:hypothetical protein